MTDPNRDREGAPGRPNRDREGAANRHRGRADMIGPHGTDAQEPLPDGHGSEPLPDGRGSDGGGGPLGFLITFPTYATWLHGDSRGSVDRDHNVPGTPMLGRDDPRQSREHRRLKHPPVLLDSQRRGVVHRTIIEVAEHRDWTLHALNVRSNHVHLVISAPDAPERVMNSLKSWCTRRMIEAGVLAPGTKVWVRHGSTRYLWKPDQLEAGCRYVCEGQGFDLDGAV